MNLEEYPVECRTCELHTEDGEICSLGYGHTCKLSLCLNMGYVYTAFPRKKNDLKKSIQKTRVKNGKSTVTTKSP